MMKRKVILLTVAMSIVAGALSAFGVGIIMNKSGVSIDGRSSAYCADKGDDAYFTKTSQVASLPDLTTAAQMGVEAVVNIESTKKVQPNQFQGQGGVDPFEFFFGPGAGRAPQRQQQPQESKGGGSGVIISKDGYIITNNHVIEGASSLKVTLNSGDSYQGKLIGADPVTDIALIKIEADNLPILNFGDSEILKLGEWVLAIGNPYGLNSTVTAGIVSAKGRSLGLMQSPQQMSIESFIQTDAAVNPGNSGGALITTDGSLVGINTLIKSPTGTYTGYSFAVPSNIARKVAADLRQYGIVQRAMLGITMQEITSDWIEQFGKEYDITERAGVFVYDAAQNGAAATAGVKKGDVITEINGTKVNTPSMVQEIISAFRPGDKVKIVAKRGSSVKQFDITLRNRSGNEQLMSKSDVDMINELGAELRPVGDKLKKELRIRGGLQVISMKQDGLLARSRVKLGYIITAINEQQVNSIEDLNLITDKLQSIDGIYPDGRIVSYQTL